MFKPFQVTLKHPNCPQAAMRASEERANELRRAASEELGAAAQPSVQRYEVAVFEKS